MISSCSFIHPPHTMHSSIEVHLLYRLSIYNSNQVYDAYHSHLFIIAVSTRRNSWLGQDHFYVSDTADSHAMCSSVSSVSLEVADAASEHSIVTTQVASQQANQVLYRTSKSVLYIRSVRKTQRDGGCVCETNTRCLPTNGNLYPSFPSLKRCPQRTVLSRLSHHYWRSSSQS